MYDCLLSILPVVEERQLSNDRYKQPMREEIKKKKKLSFLEIVHSFPLFPTIFDFYSIQIYTFSSSVDETFPDFFFLELHFHCIVQSIHLSYVHPLIKLKHIFLFQIAHTLHLYSNSF